jgi:hypothetical protein
MFHQSQRVGTVGGHQRDISTAWFSRLRNDVNESNDVPEVDGSANRASNCSLIVWSRCSAADGSPKIAGGIDGLRFQIAEDFDIYYHRLECATQRQTGSPAARHV